MSRTGHDRRRASDARRLVHDLVESQMPGAHRGFIGGEKDNVLELNMALGQLSPSTSTVGAGG
jgi:K+-transporting ATPase c subunit